MKSDKTEEYFEAKVRNLILSVERDYYPKFTFFLDGRQKRLADEILRKEHCSNYRYEGGFDGAERMMLGVYPDYLSEEELSFPIKLICFRYPKQFSLSHRDFLGSLMSFQVKREVVGDIVVGEGIAVVAVEEAIAPYLLDNVKKIGRIGVEAELTEHSPIEKKQEFLEIGGTVASLRLDCVLALLTKLSRTKTVELLQSGRVCVNFMETDSPSLLVKPKDMISVRGYGKYLISEEMRLTKKDRLYLTAYQYL
jgi:RNA-binding protein YlmH